MYVCMYVCMYVRMYVCTYVCEVSQPVIWNSEFHLLSLFLPRGGLIGTNQLSVVEKSGIPGEKTARP